MNTPSTAIQFQFRHLRRRFVGKQRRAVGPIEATALLNVILLLFLFVYASQRFVLQPAVRINLPVAPFHDAAPYSTFVVLLPRAGGAYFNDQRFASVADLRQALAGARERAAEDGADVLLIEADGHIPYERVMEVYSLAIETGFRQVALASRPPLDAAAP